jgi:hypothetical protein
MNYSLEYVTMQYIETMTVTHSNSCNIAMQLSKNSKGMSLSDVT